MTDFRLVYIAGRGHSGTTFLDVLLGNASEVESLGEVVSGLNRGLEEQCSCGEVVRDCAFWEAVRERYRRDAGGDLNEAGRWLYRHSDFRRFPDAWRAESHGGGVWDEYQRLNDQLFSAVSEVTGKSVLLDSNKEYTRALTILKGSETSRVIHLHRDPVAVIGSYYYRQSRGMPLKFMKGEYYPGRARMLALALPAAGWSVGMILGYLLQRRFRERVMHVSYEDLCLDPARELTRIADFLSLDLSEVIEGVEAEHAFPVGHNIGGNELRHEGTFKFVPNVGGRRHIPWHYRVMTRVLSFPGAIVRRFAM